RRERSMRPSATPVAHSLPTNAGKRNAAEIAQNHMHSSTRLPTALGKICYRCIQRECAGMGTVRSLLVLLALAVTAAQGDAAPAPRPDEPRRSEAKPKEADPPPITFFIAKGEAGMCGPGCGEWIAADGTIDRAAGQRLRAFLERTGGRKLPIYF